MQRTHHFFLLIMKLTEEEDWRGEVEHIQCKCCRKGERWMLGAKRRQGGRETIKTGGNA